MVVTGGFVRLSTISTAPVSCGLCVRRHRVIFDAVDMGNGVSQSGFVDVGFL